MEEESSSLINAAPRKVRFAPKVPIRRTPKAAEPEIEVHPDAEAAETRELLKRVNEGYQRQGTKVEKTSAPVQVVFGGTSSTTMRSYGGSSRSGSGSGSGRGSGSGSGSGSSSGSRPQAVASHASISGTPSDGPTPKASYTDKNDEYLDPWDLSSNYPVTLPLRMPYSGDPELLNKEFEEDMEYDETKINAAEELGLMKESEEARILCLKLPLSLPVVKRSASAKGKEIVNNMKPSRSMGSPEKGCSLEELPPGFMGKMLVYKSGAIKMKIGETLFDVTPGSDGSCPQNVTAINTKEKHCCDIGQINKSAIVTPNIDSLLD